MSAVSVEEYSIFMAQELARVMPLYRLSATQRDVWDTLLGHMQHGGQVPLTRDQIAHRLDIHPNSVSRAMGRLRELGLIWRINLGLWQINPVIAFKGSDEEWAEAINSMPTDVPEVPFPAYHVRPPRRAKRPHLQSVPTGCPAR